MNINNPANKRMFDERARMTSKHLHPEDKNFLVMNNVSGKPGFLKFAVHAYA